MNFWDRWKRLEERIEKFEIKLHWYMRKHWWQILLITLAINACLIAMLFFTGHLEEAYFSSVLLVMLYLCFFLQVAFRDPFFGRGTTPIVSPALYIFELIIIVLYIFDVI